MSDTEDSLAARPRWALLALISLVALNLRPALASVGPLVEDIQSGTGVSSAALGMLTTLPLIAFGVLSLFAPAVSRGLGMERALVLGLFLVGGGTALRASPNTALLFVGTGVLGVGVALGNVLLPALAKRCFPSRPGPITSLYSSVMGLGAALAAGVSVPLAAAVGWRAALGLWAVPAGVALLAWAPLAWPSPVRGAVRARGGLGTVVRSPVAWQVALYLGLQSTSFYVLLTWLPAFLQSQGMSESAAGGLLALSQVTGIAGTALIPVWAGGTRNQRGIVWALTVFEAVGLVGLLTGGTTWATAWVLLLGFILGGTFALALTFLAIRSPDVETASTLSGMAQSVGYLLSAAGPPAFGAAFDVTGAWTLPFAGLFGVLAAKLLAGLAAGRPQVIGESAAP